MIRIEYVYPNIGEFSQRQPIPRKRGSLRQRWEKAKELNCRYIEVPADFIRRRRLIHEDEWALPLKVGDFLTPSAINTLYAEDENLPPNLEYVLHTDPAQESNHRLRWYDSKWLEDFITMTVNLVMFFGKAPSLIEIHPGKKSVEWERRSTNPISDILESSKTILEKLREKLNSEPIILVENRTEQVISTGGEIALFSEVLNEDFPELVNRVGIVLDIEQMYTQSKRANLDFKQQLWSIPPEIVKGLHIHGCIYRNKKFYAHQLPRGKDEIIPWEIVSENIKAIKNSASMLIVNPETLNDKNARLTKQFCESELGL